jgi:hypothetical protein
MRLAGGNARGGDGGGCGVSDDLLINSILDDPSDDGFGTLRTATTLHRESPKRRMLRMERERACAEQIGHLPEPGHEVVMLMTGDWHGWDIVSAVLHLTQPATIVSLKIATLGFNRTQARHLADLIDAGAIASMVMVVSEIFSSASNGEYHALSDLLSERGQTLATTRNHAKILCFELNDGRKLVAHGSLNLRRCNAYEQVVLAADADLHDFFASYIDEVAGAAT